MTLQSIIAKLPWWTIPFTQSPSRTWAQVKTSWAATEASRGAKSAYRMHGEGVTVQELFDMHERCSMGDDFDRGFYAACILMETQAQGYGEYSLTISMPKDPAYWAHHIRKTKWY